MSIFCVSPQTITTPPKPPVYYPPPTTARLVYKQMGLFVANYLCYVNKMLPSGFCGCRQKKKNVNSHGALLFKTRRYRSQRTCSGILYESQCHAQLNRVV